MRSCSGWPSGVWIDGERRTAPDGSSFAWQHWTHTFDFAIVAGEGDWRAAGFPRGAQETAHPLHARQVPATEGALPATLSLMSVEPAEVVLTAAKPAGNPLASGSVIPPAEAITLRVYESTGSAATASIAGARRDSRGLAHRSPGGEGRTGRRRRRTRAGRTGCRGRGDAPAGTRHPHGNRPGNRHGTRAADPHAVLAAQRRPGTGRQPAGERARDADPGEARRRASPVGRHGELQRPSGSRPGRTGAAAGLADRAGSGPGLRPRTGGARENHGRGARVRTRPAGTCSPPGSPTTTVSSSKTRPRSWSVRRRCGTTWSTSGSRPRRSP